MAKPNEFTLDDALDIAKKHHINGNITLADRTYKDILKTYPDHFKCLHYLGILAYQRNAVDESAQYLKRAIEVDDSNAETYNAYAVVLELTGNMTMALKMWEKAITLDPEFPDAYSNYGNALWKKGDFKAAQEACEKAIAINPQYHGALINLGNALMSQGEHKEAVEKWKKALEINPHHASAHINIGNSLRELGKIKESEEHCRKALELSPDDPNALLNLANALRDQGQYGESEQLYRQSTDIKPEFVLGHNNRAIALMHMFRYDEALVATRYALAFDPNSFETLGTKAIILKELNKLYEAEEAARKALALSPDSVEARVDLGEILSLLNHHDEAASLFDEAIELQPENPRIFIKLSNALEKSNRTEEAIEHIKKAVELNPEMPEAYWSMGATYFISNNIDKALEALNKALELKPDFIGSYVTKAELLQSLGKMDESQALVEEALKINDNVPNLYYTLSNVKKFKPDDPHLEKMKEIADNSHKLSYQQRAVIYYALYRAYEKMKDYNAAFDYLKKGADSKWEGLNYNPKTQRNTYKGIKNVFANKLESNPNVGCDSNVPIFVLGMPRSGTTLTEQIIASHPEVYGAGELSILTNLEREMGLPSKDNAKEWGQAYVDTIKNINETTQGAKRITDKMPGNYSRIGSIFLALPNAKIIHCRRSPIDTCLSCYKQLFSRGHEWSYDFDAMAQHYADYLSLMEHWRNVLPEGSFLEINYEDTINDFENQARKLIDFVDLEWDDACLSPHKAKRSVLTASKAQVVKPIYKTSVEGWKRYEEQLAPLVEALEKHT
jgi:tetratricopeptide (TPR) repeat protein